MSKSRAQNPAGSGVVLYRNKYSESSPVEIKINIPSSLDSEIEEYREFLGEHAEVATSKDKVVEESLKDTFKADVLFTQWREKKAKDKAGKLKDKNLDDDLDKVLDQNLKGVQNQPPKIGTQPAANGSTTVGATA